MEPDPLLEPVERYYSGKVDEHGPTARGVDWRDEASQELRFTQLLKLCDLDAPFTINDYGCGYGALAAYLAERGCRFRYTGFDISEQMLEQARALLGDSDRCRFVSSEDELEPADHTVASGIFNVRLHAPDEDWERLLLATLDRLDALSGRGFAFNVLTSYSDADKMRPDLYYADPCVLFDHCKRRYSRWVALLHDYGLYEFTILVRTEPAKQ
jgi:SAM-dependent methyltransferase